VFSRYKLREPKYDAPTTPHYLVSVDLGKRKVGVGLAWVDPGADKVLVVKAETVTCGGGARAMAHAVVSSVAVEGDVYWVCEWPMKYDDKRLYHDALDELYAVGNEIEMLIRGWDEKYRPGEWKGNVPKAAHHRRLAASLRPEELEVMPPLKEHDAWDAAGICLFATARTKRGGVQFK
jgi:hypothetical protein